MKGRTVYRNGNTGITVTVSKPAEQLIGPAQVAEFVKALTELLNLAWIKHAYVSKGPGVLIVKFPWYEGMTETWEIPVKR